MPFSVNHAGWIFDCSLPALSGGGLRISGAHFQGRMVLAEATQPFVLVPYHGNEPHFKDGLGGDGLGSPFVALSPVAPNASKGAMEARNIDGKTVWETVQATDDNLYHPTNNPQGAIMLETKEGGLLEPARAIVWAKLQAVNYQYVQRWEFLADGSVEIKVGLAAQLWQLFHHHGSLDQGKLGHIHNFYFRLDFDIEKPLGNVVEEFQHVGLGANQDSWTPLLKEQRRVTAPGGFTKWRVALAAAKPNGQRPSYEIIPGSEGAPDGTYSTGDLWAMRRRRTFVLRAPFRPGIFFGPLELGSDVGATDEKLMDYANEESLIGQDVVVWHCLRTHHEPRVLAGEGESDPIYGEEENVVPYEFIGFRLQPRHFLDRTPVELYPTNPPSPFPE